MDGGPELVTLRQRTAGLKSRSDSLQSSYWRRRMEVAKGAVERRLVTLDHEREAIDYGLAAATYEMSVATLGTGGEFRTDSLSTERRDEARARMTRFLEDYPRSAARGETRFRLADLLLVEAKEHFNRRMARFLDDDLPAQGIDDRALVPFVDYEAALRLYRDILETDASFPHRDAVLFNLGMILSDQGESESRGHLEELVDSFPDSPFCQEAYLRLGDDRFDRAQFTASVPRYEQAAEGSDPGLTAIALYRMGWAHYSQDQFDASADAFRRLLDHYTSGQEIALKTDLRTEAEDYLIHSMVRAGGAAFFARYFDGIGPRPYEPQMLAGMAQLVRDFSLYSEAVAIDQLYLERYPDDPGALGAARRMVDSYEQQNRPREAREARLAYAPRFIPGSRWMNLNTADSLQAKGEDFARTSYQFVALHYHHEARKAGDKTELWDTALDLYHTLLEYWPHHAESGKYHLYAGEAAAKLRYHSTALMHYETAVFEFYSKEASIESRADLGDMKYYTIKLSPETYEYVLDADWQRLAITDEWYRSTIEAPAALGVDSLAAAVRTTADGFLLRHGDDPRAPDALWRKANLGFARSTVRKLSTAPVMHIRKR
jgi:tetratricopeptide (TPR) repeat protein